MQTIARWSEGVGRGQWRWGGIYACTITQIRNNEC